MQETWTRLVSFKARLTELEISTRMQKLKTRLQTCWPVWMVVLMVLRPRRFMLEYVHAYRDYSRFRQSIQDFQMAIMKSVAYSSGREKESLLIVAGQAMNVQWLQIWSVLGAWLGLSSCYRVLAITTRQKPIQNLYLRLFRFRLIYKLLRVLGLVS